MLPALTCIINAIVYLFIFFFFQVWGCLIRMATERSMLLASLPLVSTLNITALTNFFFEKFLILPLSSSCCRAAPRADQPWREAERRWCWHAACMRKPGLCVRRSQLRGWAKEEEWMNEWMKKNKNKNKKKKERKKERKKIPLCHHHCCNYYCLLSRLILSLFFHFLSFAEFVRMVMNGWSPQSRPFLLSFFFFRSKSLRCFPLPFSLSTFRDCLSLFFLSLSRSLFWPSTPN